MRCLALLSLLLALPTAAQVPTAGFTLGARLLGAGLSAEPPGGGDTQTDTGGGFGARVGYGVSRSVTLFLAVEGASMTPDGGGDRYGLGVADLGARFHLNPSARLNPYLTAALTGQTAAFDVPGTSDNLEVRGGGLTVGGGLLYGLSRTIALDVSLDLTGARFTEVSFQGSSTTNFDDIDAGIARFGIGIVANP